MPEKRLKKIKLNSEFELTYTLRKNPRAKRLILRINPGNKVSLTVPSFVSTSECNEFILSRSTWLLSNLKSYESSSVARNQKIDYLENKIPALRLVKEKVEIHNQYYNFDYNRIFIKDQSTRWGSCSTNKNLNFNYRIMFLPEELQDYIIVHELCHLKEMNHSYRFWDLVAEKIPNHKYLRRKLRRIEGEIFR